MKRTLMKLVCAGVFASAVAHAGNPGGATEGSVLPSPEPLRLQKNRTAEEAAALRSQQCSNDGFPSQVQGKQVPEARDARVRFPAEQKQALKQALPEGQWKPERPLDAKVKLKARLKPEEDRGD